MGSQVDGAIVAIGDGMGNGVAHGMGRANSRVVIGNRLEQAGLAKPLEWLSRFSFG